MTQELIEGKTLREIAEMPMMEARKLMRESGHRWFGADKDSEPKEEDAKALNAWMAYKD